MKAVSEKKYLYDGELVEIVSQSAYDLTVTIKEVESGSVHSGIGMDELEVACKHCGKAA